MTLKRYWQKRNFTQTPEPKGKIKSGTSTKKYLFVIQKHAASHLHYDFRLELNGVLLSWAVPKGPSLDPTIKRLAMHVEDHPLDYGSFQGIIPKGQYGGGTVMLWDTGEWISEDSDPEQAYRKGHLSFVLKAKKLKGRWHLFRINKNDKTWLLVKVNDRYAKSMSDYDITKAKPDSVLNKHSLEEIAEYENHVYESNRANRKSAAPKKKSFVKKKLIPNLNLPIKSFPTYIYPELATLAAEPPQGDQWLHEIKLDGYRILAFKKNTTRLMTRNKNNWTQYFLSIAKEIDKLPVKHIVFDGEVVVLDEEQHSNFQLLQNTIKGDRTRPLVYYIFDVLYFDQYDLRTLPLLQRKSILKQILPDKHPILRYNDHVQGSGKAVFKKACQLGLEGIVSKDANSTYQSKRTRDWIKIKCVQRQEFVVGGFTEPQRSRQYFGSLLLGTYNKNHELIYHGHVGTGFTADSLKSLHRLLIKNQSPKNPFHSRLTGIKRVTWVKPVLVVEVAFTEWTTDGILRHPSFKGVRADKPAKQIVREREIEKISTSLRGKTK